MTTKRSPSPYVAALALLAMAVAACSPESAATASPSTSASAASTAPTGSGPGSSTDPLAALADAAAAEGTLATIALPRDWCNYGEIIDAFKTKYGLAVNELDANARSGDELDAITANKASPGPQAPDVIDVGLSFTATAKATGLLAPYKVASWDTIPASAKDPDGNWYGAYYGVLAFEINTAVIRNVPQDWSDLLRPEYKGKIALAGDPRVSPQATQAVFAAALANGGSLNDATKGLAFFKQLQDTGNLLPVIAKPASIVSGETPITIRWTYYSLVSRDSTAVSGGPNLEVVVPTTGRLAGVYYQAISKYAPHPNAARLWEEYLYSDEGQNLWLKGYCYPIRYGDLGARSLVPPDQLAKLPDVSAAAFPTLAQFNKATDLITKNWDKVVGVDIK